MDICICVPKKCEFGYTNPHPVATDMNFEKVADTDTFLKPENRYEYSHMDEFFWIRISAYGCGYADIYI